MIATFWFLTVHSVRNRLARQARRLRSPRYALALLVGIGYFWFLFGRGRSGSLPAPALLGDWVPYVVSLGLAILAAKWWLFGSDRTALAFSQAEVQFLFPAPLSRQDLIKWKLLRGQAAVLITSFIWTLLLRRGGGAMAFLRVPALWVIFSTLTMHRLSATLVRESAAEEGRIGVRRNIVPLGLFAMAAGALVWSAAAAFPVLRAAYARGDLMAAALATLEGPIPSVVLWPFRAIVAPLFAKGAAAWLYAFVPALLLMLVHFPWLLRSDTAFEEAAAEASVVRAAQVAARRARRTGAGPAPSASRKGVSRPWFPLRPVGEPSVAIVWKNMIAATRGLSASTVLIVALVVIGVAVGTPLWSDPSDRRISVFVGTVAVGALAMLLVLGPNMVRNDLRRDMLNLEMLRSYPVSGASLVAAEIASSALALTAMQIVLLVLALFALADSPRIPLTGTDRLVIAAVGSVALLALNAITLSIQNAIALLFPAWVRLGTDSPGGVETMGQGILNVVGMAVLTIVALLAPAVAGAGATIILGAPVRVATIAPGVLAAVAVIGIEMFFVVYWLGTVFERTDPSSDGAFA